MSYQYDGREIFSMIEVYHDAIPHLAGVSMRDFFMTPNLCARAWRDGVARFNELIGDVCPSRPVAPPPISYGHLMCLGAPVNLPEDGEPNVAPFAGSIDEAIDILHAKNGMDFAAHEWFRHYLDMWRYLKEQFPDVHMPFSGFGSQGPFTSAVLMRGQEFYLDLLDEPEKCQTFLRLMVDSVVAFGRLIRRINGEPEELPGGNFIADDFASLISPAQWPEFVIPAINRHFEGICKPGGYRFLHLESLTPAHLPLLKELKLSHYQPSVSPALTLENVKANLDAAITFDWLLYAYQVTAMSDEEIQTWVDKTAEAGVTRIRTQVGAYAIQTNKLDRIRAFHAAFKKYAV